MHGPIPLAFAGFGRSACLTLGIIGNSTTEILVTLLV
jgi:hypothetical protein